MVEPWLTIIGLNEDGIAGLCPAAQAALAQAPVIVGAARHLALAQAGSRGLPWPLPFDPAPVLARRGQRTVVLASGDPFWWGAGSTLARRLAPQEWRCYGQPSTFSLVAAHLGWALQETVCLGLHNRPHEQLLAHLAPGRQLIALLSGGAAALQLATWLDAHGWGASRLWLGECIGGPRARWRSGTASALARDLAQDPAHAPVCAALQAEGGTALPAVAGRADDWFAHDGQITKAPVRAMTLAALRPWPGALLWDLGAGSGSVAVEWCLAGGRALAVEQQAQRLRHIEDNRQRFGLQEALQAIHGRTPQALQGLPPPDAVFLGGGLNAALWQALLPLLPVGCRVVANAVALQTQALLQQLHAAHGGELWQLQLAQAQPLGRMQAWQPARPLLQWSWQR